MTHQTKRIVVLGGTGFLGQHVTRLLRERFGEVVSLSRRSGVDLMDLPAFVAALKREKPDVIVNCAAHVGSVHYAMRNAATMIHDNLTIILNLYRGVLESGLATTIVNPISNCSYPGEAVVQREAEWQNGMVHDSVLAYGSPRRMIHALADAYRKQHGLRTVNWIIANAYGPGDYTDPDKVHALNGIVIRMIQAQRRGDREFEIWGSGKPIREWVYIEDAARILVESIALEEQVYPINLAQNRGYSVEEIAREVAQVLAFDVRFTFNPKYADGAPVKILDDARFRTCRPDFVFTPLPVGIRNTVRYYLDVLPRGSERG